MNENGNDVDLNKNTLYNVIIRKWWKREVCALSVVEKNEEKIAKLSRELGLKRASDSDFRNISSLVPEKKKTASKAPSTDTTTVMVEVGGSEIKGQAIPKRAAVVEEEKHAGIEYDGDAQTESGWKFEIPLLSIEF